MKGLFEVSVEFSKKFMCCQDLIRAYWIAVFELIRVRRSKIRDHAYGEDFGAIDSNTEHDRTLAAFAIGVNQKIGSSAYPLVFSIDDFGLL